MKKINLFSWLLFAILTSSVAWAKVPILADPSLLKSAGIEVLNQSHSVEVGYGLAGSEELEKLSALSHKNGRCAGYQVIDWDTKPHQVFKNLEQLELKNKNFMSMPRARALIEYDANIHAAVQKVEAAKIRESVNWLVGFGGRYHASAQPNVHTEALAARLNQMIVGLKYPARVELVSHRRTNQKSVVLTLTGSLKPDEIVVLGGHLDSINHDFGKNKNDAPGADDNASGSSALLEALRVILQGEQPKKTLQFMWYAAEEVGLYGSTEIAKSYRDLGRNVIGVLQLDMTLHPGSGPMRISSMTDFTDARLRSILLEINRHYLNVTVIDDKCGYGCSDHAAWHERGYPALMPFESHGDDMNPQIHKNTDVINNWSNFDHAAVFAKLAVAFAYVLGN